MSAQTKTYAGTVTAGNSPVTLNVASDLGEAGSKGELHIKSGSSALLFEIEQDEGVWSEQFEAPAGVYRALDDFKVIKQIRLTRDSADSEYEIVVSRG